jgi:hypothetical protein
MLMRGEDHWEHGLCWITNAMYAYFIAVEQVLRAVLCEDGIAAHRGNAMNVAVKHVQVHPAVAIAWAAVADLLWVLAPSSELIQAVRTAVEIR